MKAIYPVQQLEKNTKFIRSSDLNIGGSGSKRILEILKKLSGKKYVTGHGAKNYLDHNSFEEENVKAQQASM